MSRLRHPPMLVPLADIPTNDRNFWLIVAMAGATIFLAVVRPAMRKKKDPLARSPGRSSLAQQRNVERQMESLLVELSEMARQITAQLDTRSAKLESLIQDADARIAALAAQQADAPPRAELAARSEAASRVPVAVPGNGPDQDASAAAAMQSAAAQAATMAVEPMPPNPQHAQVYALADLGTAATDIARQLNRPRGEVELILALRPRGG